MSIEDLIANHDGRAADAARAGSGSARLSVVTSRQPLEAVLDVFEVEDPDTVLDHAALARACAALQAGRAEGFAIIRQNLEGEVHRIGARRTELDDVLVALSREADRLEAEVARTERSRALPGERATTAELGRGSAANADESGDHHDDPDVALELAEEFETLAAVRAHSSRFESGPESPAVAAAEAELATARAELARVRAAAGVIAPDLVAAAQRCHVQVEAAETELAAAKRSERVAARDRLAAALGAERVALDACGFSTYATLLLRVAQGGTHPDDDERIAVAQHTVAHAEAARRRALAAAELPSHVELDDAELDLRARAAQLLGRLPGADPATELRAVARPRRLHVVAAAPVPVDDGAASVAPHEARLQQIDAEGEAAAAEHDRLDARLVELDRHLAAVATDPILTPETLDADDAELLVRDWLAEAGDPAVAVEVCDVLAPEALDRVLEVLLEASADRGVVVMAGTPMVAAWARAVGAEVVDRFELVEDDGDPEGDDLEDDDLEHDAVADAIAPVVEPPAVEPPAVEPEPELEPAATEPEPEPPATEPEPVPTPSVTGAPRSDTPVAPIPAPPPPPTPPSLTAATAPPPPPSPPTPRPLTAASAPPAPPVPPRFAEGDELVPADPAGVGSQRRARFERSERRAERKRQRDAKVRARASAHREQFAGAAYHEPSEIAPWARFDDAARARAQVRPAPVDEAGQARRAAAHEEADRVERATGVRVADRDDLATCVFHRNSETRIRCGRCGESFCDVCLVTVGPKRELICVECAVKAAGVRERRRR